MGEILSQMPNIMHKNLYQILKISRYFSPNSLLLLWTLSLKLGFDSSKAALMLSAEISSLVLWIKRRQFLNTLILQTSFGNENCKDSVFNMMMNTKNSISIGLRFGFCPLSLLHSLLLSMYLRFSKVLALTGILSSLCKLMG